MDLNILILFVVTILSGIIRRVNTYSYYCDASNNLRVNEGNMGQTGKFNWLGVLRVILFNGERIPKIALTGVVLVKDEYALVNAHDVSNIPLPILKDKGSVQFFPDDEESWSCKPKNYFAHPEYGPITFNTVALLQLDLKSVEGNFPLKPICWTNIAINASSYLYAAGFTDENKILEKVLYHLEYVTYPACSEFYHRAQLINKHQEPVYYICGRATSSKTQCVWDKGMVLISNATEYFTLLGFGIGGPGCAAPSRFINLQYYYEWMQEITRQDEFDQYDNRRDGFEEVPVHELLKTEPKPLGKDALKAYRKQGIIMKRHPYLFDTTAPLHFNIVPTDKNSIAVFPFNNTWESFDKACSSWRTLMYREDLVLNAKGRDGFGVYKISLYDLIIKQCTCIHMKISVEDHSSVVLSIKEQIDLSEGEAQTSSEEMVPRLYKYYPIKDLYPNNKKKSNKWQPGENVQPAFLREFFGLKNVTNYNLFVSFEVKDKVEMKVEIYGEPYPPMEATTKKKTLRVDDDERNMKQKLRDRIGGGNALLDNPLVMSRLVEDDVEIESLYGAVKKQFETKVKSTLGPKVSRPTTTTQTSTVRSPKTRSTKRKYHKVHMQTRTRNTSVYDTMNAINGSPRNVQVFRMTLAKILCFDIIMFLINS